jgi:hypothetical protein
MHQLLGLGPFDQAMRGLAKQSGGLVFWTGGGAQTKADRQECEIPSHGSCTDSRRAKTCCALPEDHSPVAHSSADDLEIHVKERTIASKRMLPV